MYDDTQVRVLLVDDVESDYLLTADLLSDVDGVAFEVEWVSTYDAALEVIGHENHDVYLFDYSLGQHDGLELLQKVVASGKNAPVILLTGHGDHEIDIKAMKAGASDFLVKGQFDAAVLERSIRYAIERKKAEKQILKMAYYDDLTGLPNRLLFRDRLNTALAIAKRYQRKVAVLVLDLDNFKRVNESLGHEIGDLLLRDVSERLRTCVRRSDTVALQDKETIQTTIARQGGDEFILLLNEIRDVTDGARVAQRILGVLSQPFSLEGNEMFATASIGIAVYPQDGEDCESLLKNADTAMYSAKSECKNSYQFYKKMMNATACQRLNLETKLRKALEQEEFEVYYQPSIDLRTGKLVGVEALIRWQHPGLGTMSPTEFIPLTEESGLIVPIGEWVLRTACTQNVACQAAGLPAIRMAVNLSSKQFRQQDLIGTIRRVLNDTGMASQYLALEITESLMMQNVQAAISVLKELNMMGIQLSLDDFGTGYSSLSYLKRFPIHTLKIDRSFVKDIITDPDDMIITKVIIAMAQNLNLKVVAEGVENEEQLEFLIKHGCDEMQGYLISPPVPAAELTEILVKESSGEGIGLSRAGRLIPTRLNRWQQIKETESLPPVLCMIL